MSKHDFDLELEHYVKDQATLASSKSVFDLLHVARAWLIEFSPGPVTADHVMEIAKMIMTLHERRQTNQIGGKMADAIQRMQGMMEQIEHDHEAEPESAES
jgi:hypothetical protein